MPATALSKSPCPSRRSLLIAGSVSLAISAIMFIEWQDELLAHTRFQAEPTRIVRSLTPADPRAVRGPTRSHPGGMWLKLRPNQPRHTPQASSGNPAAPDDAN